MPGVANLTSAFAANNKLPIFSDFVADVDPYTGSATFAIPIKVPSGRAGIQPNIQLQYNSKLSNGSLGVGWVLQLGAIQRLTTKGVPHYDNTDIFCLMMAGQTVPLIYDRAAGFYRTKTEGNFAKIEFMDNHWIVTDKQGIQYTFGEAVNAQELDPSDNTRVFGWNIERVEDVHGNYMIFSYQRFENKLYPESVKYTGNSQTGSPTFASVEFELEKRDDVTTSFVSGFSQRTPQRIYRISIYADNNLLRRSRFFSDSVLKSKG